MTVRQEESGTNLRAPTSVIAEYLKRSVSISHLLGLVLSGWLIVIAATVLGLLYGVYSVHSAGPSYMATMRVSPAESDTGLGDMANAGGLLAGLTGASAVAVPKFTLFLAAIGSEGVAHDLNQKYDLLCRIYKGECDPETHKWTRHIGVREWLNGLLAQLSGLPDPNGPRTEQDLALYLGNSITIESNKLNSMVSLQYINRKPDLAAQHLALVVKAANDYIRAQSRETQRRYVEYLTQSAAKATNVEQRQAIDTLLLQEERQLMMTEVDVPYAAKILDGPTVAPVNKAFKTIAIYTIIGLFLGLVISMARDLLPQRWRRW
ncbi:MAG TPA: hypothetical protein VFI23_15290 [Rhizomicrobium sp.]|nr:hypothetical protein [Rhizomicrobium sp.]